MRKRQAKASTTIDYPLQGIPLPLWNRARAAAERDHTTLKALLLEGLELRLALKPLPTVEEELAKVRDQIAMMRAALETAGIR